MIWFIPALLLLGTVLNRISPHFSVGSKARWVLGVVTEAFSVLTSVGCQWSPEWYGKLKFPFQSVPPDTEKPKDGGFVSLGLMLFLAAALVLLLSGCATAEKAFKGTSASTTSLRQAATAWFDADCMKTAKACPKGKPEDCAPWVKCSKTREAVYTSTNSIQLGCASGLQLLTAGFDVKAKLLLVEVGLAVEELYQKLKDLGVFSAGTKGLLEVTP
jgi:hypothetical protein